MNRSALTADDVAVAVVHYNTNDLLERCIASLRPEHPAEIVVIDNASPDGGASLARLATDGVRVIANATNVGYGAAANQALRETTAPLLLLLNADTEVTPGSIGAMAELAAQVAAAGIVAPTILNRRGLPEFSCFPFPGTLGWLMENAPLAQLVRLIPPLRRGSISLDHPKEPRQVPWVLGCAMLLRRDVLDKVGGFDEDYFMYYEEVDLCRRVTDAGFEVHHTPHAQVMHVGGASTSQVRTMMMIRHFESTMRYYNRHYSGARLAFWVAALRLKRVAMLARDSIQLVIERNPAERERLRDQKRAWNESLKLSRDYGRRNGGGPPPSARK
jgi:N-acetylglucosaminyl-diphospho-decaprenol L-rhamnosyltransferase